MVFAISTTTAGTKTRDGKHNISIIVNDGR
jgi:hypothetical protein